MYPIMLNISQLAIIVIGGGKIATRKVRTLLECGATNITVVADNITEDLKELLQPNQIKWLARAYQSGDIHAFNMVLLCTNDMAVNQQVAQEIQPMQLFNDATHKENSNFFNMPYFNIPEGIVAISTRGQSCKTSKRIRDYLKDEWIK